MGDVFDALSRSDRERPGGENSGGGPHGPHGGDALRDANSPRDATADNTPALPLKEVEHAAQNAAGGSGAGSSHGAAATQTTVSDAQRRGGSSDSAAPSAPARDGGGGRLSDSVDEDDPNLPAADGNLNGYSTEVIVHHDRGSIITEQYRAIRTQILARARNRKLQTHVITSSAPSEGKSVTSVNLGVAFAELRNQKTLLVEGDLRRPSFAHLFDRAIAPGLLHVLRGEVEDHHKAIHPTVYDNLWFLPAGDRDFTGSTELLSSPRMSRLLEDLKDEYDHIFIDSPPVITVTDACILGAQADETLLVVRMGRTHIEVVDRAKRLLRAANCELAGVVLTHMKYHVPRYLYRYV